MTSYVQYLDLSILLEERLHSAFNELRFDDEQREGITAFLAPLKVKEQSTYEHCIRVGLLARRIGRFMHLDEKALLYAGLLHDIGKAQTPLETLIKTEGWTAADAEAIKRHVLDGYRLLRGKFDFTAEVILWHHRFQEAGYPKQIPAPLHGYSLGTKTMIALYGRILAIADCYDALHRINDKHGTKQAPTGEQIKERMFEFNPDQHLLINELYDADILTTHLM